MVGKIYGDEYCRLRRGETISLIFGERLSRKHIQILMEVRKSSGLFQVGDRRKEEEEYSSVKK